MSIQRITHKKLIKYTHWYRSIVSIIIRQPYTMSNTEEFEVVPETTANVLEFCNAFRKHLRNGEFDKVFECILKDGTTSLMTIRNMIDEDDEKQNASINDMILHIECKCSDKEDEEDALIAYDRLMLLSIVDGKVSMNDLWGAQRPSRRVIKFLRRRSYEYFKSAEKVWRSRFIGNWRKVIDWCNELYSKDYGKDNVGDLVEWCMLAVNIEHHTLLPSIEQLFEMLKHIIDKQYKREKCSEMAKYILENYKDIFHGECDYTDITKLYRNISGYVRGLEDSQQIIDGVSDLRKRVLFERYGDDVECLSEFINGHKYDYYDRNAIDDGVFIESCFEECLKRGAVLKSDTFDRIVKAGKTELIGTISSICPDLEFDADILDYPMLHEYHYLLEECLKFNFSDEKKGKIMGAAMHYGKNGKILEQVFSKGWDAGLIPDKIVVEYLSLNNGEDIETILKMVKMISEHGKEITRSTLTEAMHSVLKATVKEDDDVYDNDSVTQVIKYVIELAKMGGDPGVGDNGFIKLVLQLKLYEFVKVFVDLGAKLNKNVQELMFRAVEAQDYEQVKVLVNAGAHIDADDKEMLEMAKPCKILHRYLYRTFFMEDSEW